MEPLFCIMVCFMFVFHNPSSTKSFNKYLFTTGNSPLNTRRIYMLEVNGSKHSLLPKICAVEAVGIGAINNELRTPYFITSSLKISHSQREVGFTSHKSNWNNPLLNGDPGKVS